MSFKNKCSPKIKTGSYFYNPFTKIKRFVYKLKIPRAECIQTVNPEKIKKLTPEEIFLTPKNFYKKADAKIQKAIIIATYIE